MTESIQAALDTQGFAEVVVQLTDEATASAATENGTRNLVLNHFISEIPKPRAASTILNFDANLGASAAQDMAPPAPLYLPILGVAIGFVDQNAASSLEQQQEVEAVYSAAAPSLIRPVRTMSAKADDDVTWGLRTSQIAKLWGQGLTGEGVGVAHLDTGVDADHPALQGKVDGWAQFDFQGQEVPNSNPFDSDRHGTHTAGTICGGRVNGLNIGVAPGARLYSAMVIEGGSALRRVLSGMEWSLTQPVRVLSISLGFRGFTPFLVRVMQRIRQQEVLPVVALGNEGPLTSRSPGNYPESLSVGAVDKQGRVANFSSSILFTRPQDPVQPDLVAPGVHVISAIPGDGLVAMDGTSMATPHVAGVAALLFEARNNASVDDVQSVLFETCLPLQGQSMVRQGRGLINPVAALAALERKFP